MIIYGSKAKILKTYEDSGIACQECNNQSHLFTVYQKYAHVFWIPMFPISRKQVHCACAACGNEIEPDKERKAYFRSISRTPFYLYLGLIYLVCHLIYYLADPYIEKLNDIGRLAAPKAGDVYLIKEDMTDEGEVGYYFTKVIEDRPDTLYVIQTYLYYDGPVDRLSAGNFFVEDEYYFFIKKDLRSLYNEGYIRKVYRKYPKNSRFEQSGPLPEEDEEEE